MSFIQRLLSLGFIPVIALLALQIFSPDTFRSFHDVIQPYIVGTPLVHFFPDTTLLRSETPIIITSTTHWSHVEKIAAVAVELASLGYPITFITGRVFEKHISSLHPNIKFSATLGHDDKLNDEDVKTYLSLPPGEEQELFIMKKVLVDAMPEQHETVQIQLRKLREKHGKSKPLIVMFDQSATGHYPILFGSPGIKPDANIGISIAPLTLDSNDTFPFRLGKIPHVGPDAKAVHWAAYQKHYQSRFYRDLNEYWWAKLREIGSSPNTNHGILHTMNAQSDHLLTIGIPEFEFTRSDVRNDIRFFGAFKKVGKMGEEEPQLPTWWDDIAKAKKEGKKIIAVSQGTVETNPEDLVLPTLDALKDRKDVLIIASFVVQEPEDVPNLVVPDNTRVAKFVPYDQLIPLVDLLISNGGYGGLQQALRLGVPMVVAGEGQDKATTTALVEWSGVGINLGKRQPGAERIANAVDKVLKDDSYRKKAKTLSKEYDKYDVGQVFDTMVQEVVRDWFQKPVAGKDEL